MISHMRRLAKFFDNKRVKEIIQVRVKEKRYSDYYSKLNQLNQSQNKKRTTINDKI
jgi:hypothetical protein